VLGQIGDWRQPGLSREEQMFFAEGAHALRFEGAKNSPKPEDLLKIRRTADKGADLYTTMNVVQENVIKGGMRFLRPRVDENGRTMRPIRASTKEVTSIDGDTRLNRELWALAEKMRRADSRLNQASCGLCHEGGARVGSRVGHRQGGGDHDTRRPPHRGEGARRAPRSPPPNHEEWK